jgi:hypothetical protein
MITRIMSEPRDYENGVADVLAFLLGDQAEVTRNEYLPGHLGGVRRQIDVVVRWQSNTERVRTLIVDCKRWAQKVDIRDVENLLGLVEDTQADSGLLVTTNGASKAAFTRARNAPAMRINLMSLDELKQWSPEGTVQVTYRIKADRQADAERAIRNAGFRTVLTDSYPHTADQILVESFRHFGSKSPDGEVQSDGFAKCEAALTQSGVSFERVANGVTIDGGTPAHRWLQVTAGGVPTGLRMLAANDAEIDDRLDTLSASPPLSSIPRSELSVERPSEWPAPSLFDVVGLS